MRQRITTSLLIFFLLLASPGPGFAQVEASPWASAEPYAEKAAQKLGFGVLNVLTGWSALFFEPGRTDSFWGGLGKGIVYTITNTAGGALHAATFPFPVDIPLPGGGVHFD